MWPNWTNTLGPWQWATLLAIPPLIVLLYFLRLKRRPLEVPSTYLWLKSIEDLQVNSLWQRLRQSLLLILQLLLVALVALALLRPSWRGNDLMGGRYIFLIDASASMASTDVKPTRLGVAKRQVEMLIDKMKNGDKAMLISFSDRAKVEQPYTDNRNELRRRLAAVKQTDRTTTLVEALHVASGLANPGRSATDITDEQVAEALPARLFIISDGKFADVENFNLGNLEATFLPIGKPTAENLAVGALSTRTSDEHPDHLQAFARIDSFSDNDRKVDVEIYFEGSLIDANQILVPASKSASVVFDLENVATGMVEFRAANNDQLALDDSAWSAINRPRRARVLLVAATPNEPLSFALATDAVQQIADVTNKPAEFLRTEEYRANAANGAYDLIVFDRCQPEKMPQANTLFIGVLPASPTEWRGDNTVSAPQIVDTDRTHPLMQFVEMADVLIDEARPLKPPGGATVLIHGSAGPLLAIGPRQSFEDVVMGFELYGDNDVHTNWPVRRSFPVFVLNLLEYLGVQAQVVAQQASIIPGHQLNLRLDTAASSVTFQTPDARNIKVPRSSAGTFDFAETEMLGGYRVVDAGEIAYRFSVNLFNAAESDIRPRTKNTVKLGHVEVQGFSQAQTTQRNIWKWIVLAALGVLLGEWYIYNRRLYL